ncbi:MAG: ABC transporter permease [Acidobacteria bacterium]|nr:ABC transporter permease [Acidobacteriota bacterium]MBW4045700.1 ABC transporter permease [Acidobacteriota bacterium]
MHSALLIAKREYLERVRSKAFLLTTILLPLFMGGIMAGSIFAASKGGGLKHLAIASNDAGLAAAVKAQVQKGDNHPESVMVVAPATEADRQELVRQVDARTLDGYLWLDLKPGKSVPQAIYASRTSADVFSVSRLQDAVSQALMRQQLAARGMAADQVDDLLRKVDVKTAQVKNGAIITSDASKSFIGAYVMIMMLYFVVVFYGMNVARSVIEEKTSRIFEVLLATARPESLLMGKLLGVGAAGLTQVGAWFLLLAVYSGSAIAARAGVNGFASFGITPLQLGFFAIYFLLGFFFYSAVAAGFGASVSSEQEVQQFSFFIVAPLLVGLIMMSYILSNPNSALSVGLSLFPPCTPIVMYLRLCSQTPPMWQLALSVVLMVAAIWVAIWIAARIYRVGILMYGKRATLPEMLRWLRYS